MKELSIEEKAKRYDQAIKVAKSKIKNDKDHVLYEDDVIEMFPELKESKDEKIRKSLSAYFAKFKPNDMWDADFSFGDIVAWLERQGEQKPVDKVEPKFKVGDRIKKIGIGYESWVITDIDEMHNEYEGRYEEGYSTSLSFFEQDNFELVKQKPADEVGNYDHKEVLQTIINEQKPAWSEEDERIYQSIMDDTVQENQLNGEQTNWLRDIKYRYFPLPKQERSDEDRRKLNRIYSILRQAADTHAFSTTCRLIGDKECIELQDFLRSIIPQQRQERSEWWKPSDEQMRVLDLAIRCGINRGTTEETTLVSLFNDLKKLK